MERGAPKGNRNGAKAKTWEGAIRRALYEDRDALQAVAREVLEAAKEGQPWAVTELRNTLDGKPKEHVEHSGTVEHLSYADFLSGKIRDSRIPDEDSESASVQ